MRELKFDRETVVRNGNASHSTWVRELKFICWCKSIWKQGRTPRECVSWNGEKAYEEDEGEGRTPRECVSWNVYHTIFLVYICGRTPRECMSWNFDVSTDYLLGKVALHVSAWVEMTIVFESGRRGELHSTWVCKLKSTFSLASIACIKSLSPY